MRNRRRVPVLALALAVSLVAAACSNSDTKASGVSSTTAGGSGGADVENPGKNVPVDAPGVTDTEIRVGGVASVTNPLGGTYGDAFEGVKAYFDMVNASGGIYGRKLVLAAERDDKLGNNKVEVEGLLTQDKVFAVLPVASLLFTGADTLVKENVPTFGWTINLEWQGSDANPKSNLFGQTGSFLCFDCPSPTLPWLAKQTDRHKVAVLSYAVEQAAKCADGVKAAFDKYGEAADAELAFIDKSLAFGNADLSVQVSKMKQAGVDLVTTCLDLNGVVTLAKEMKKQELKAIAYLPNAYDHEFVDEFGDLFEGSYVRTDFVQWEVEDKPEGLQTYLDAIDEAGQEPSENSLVGWLNADLFVTGLREAGPAFSREKLIDAVNKLTNYKAGGIITGVDWTTAHTSLAREGEACQFLSKIVDSEFKPVFAKPGKPFVCAVDKGGELVTRYDA